MHPRPGSASQSRADGRSEPSDTTRVPLTDRGAKAAERTFLGALALALPFWVWAGRGRWFHHDEWRFLADGDAGSLRGLFLPHNEHWTTIPIVVYRVLWHLFGLNHYLPYQLLSIATHLAIAALLRIIMVRSGVGGWLATAACTAFLFFGAAAADVVWAFQITFEGAVALGLLQLVLADHEGQIDRRDGYALLAGLAALMCAGPALATVAIVGLAVWLRRGWLAATLQVVPLAAIYASWFVLIGHEGYPDLPAPPALGVIRFASIGLENALWQFATNRGLELALAMIVVAGVLVGWRHERLVFLRRSAVPVSMAAGAVFFFLLTGHSRYVLGLDFARSPRYVHVGMILLLPLLTVAADAIVRRYPDLASAAVVVFLVGMAPNAARARIAPTSTPPRDLVLALAQIDESRALPRDFVPVPGSGVGAITLGWLLDGARTGKIPTPRLDDSWLEQARAITTLNRVPAPVGLRSCAAFGKPIERNLRAGDTIDLVGPVLVDARLPDGTAVGSPVYSGPAPYRLVAVRDHIHIRIVAFNDQARRCS